MPTISLVTTIDPLAPITLWGLAAVAFFCATSLIPLFLTLRQLRKLKESDSVRQLSLQLEDETIVKKLEIIVGPLITSTVRDHDNASFVHAQALVRYPSMEQFNGAVQRITAEVANVRSIIEANERRRGEDMTEIRRLISDSNAERKKDFSELRSNVASALGERPPL